MTIAHGSAFDLAHYKPDIKVKQISKAASRASTKARNTQMQEGTGWGIGVIPGMGDQQVIGRIVGEVEARREKRAKRNQQG